MAKVSNKKVVAVVVTYNRKELLSECIDALLNQDYNNCDVLVVDNASTDGTKEYISKQLKNEKVLYINTGANLGGAGGFNYGIKEAYKMGYEYIWIMDDDTIVKKDSLPKLMDADKKLNGDYGYLSSVALWTDLTPCRMNIQKTYNKYYCNDENLVRTYMSTFVSMFFKREVIEKIGLPIKEFFIWGDDVEYSNRISKKYNCYVVKNSIVIHKTKNNVGSNIAIDNDRIERYSYAYRNEVYIARKNGIKGRLKQFLKVNYHLLKVLIKSKKNRMKKFKVIISSSFKGIRFNPNVEYVRDCTRVLEVFGEPFSNGGQESFIMNIYRNINKEKIHMDFYTPYYCDNAKYKEEIEKYGCNVFSDNGKFYNNKGNKRDFKNNLKRFLNENKDKYDVVHIHSGSIFSLAVGAKIAKKNSIKKIIVHSHSAGFNNLKHNISKILFSRYFYKYPTDLWSCSRVAAYWKFPKKLVDNGKVKIIKNTIDIDKYAFNLKLRKKLRSKLNISDSSIVIGTVGRMTAEKNQLFLLDLFKKMKNNYYLLIIGDGPLRNEIESKISNEKIENVILLGKQSNVNEWLNAFDVFVLPSIYEGFPVTAIEAQANELPCVFSKNITNECKINNNVLFLPIDDVDSWVNSIISLNININNRNKQNDRILEYDTKKYVKYLENKYIDEE